MAATNALLVAAVLLIGGVSLAVLAILAIGIHSDSRSRHLSNSPRTYAGSITRKVLGMTVRISNSSHTAPEED